MFCLRSWIPVLFILSNASPMYLLLFLTANYFLHRPCVYCSLLLGILVLALFDFRRNWFESPGSAISDDFTNTTQSITIPDIFRDAATLIIAAANTGVQALMHIVTGHNLQSTIWSGWDGMSSLGLVELLKGRREVRIACVNAVLRL